MSKQVLPCEIRLQEEITKNLLRLELYPFSVICSFVVNEGGTVAITFHIKEDLLEFLRYLDYDNQCDKSGYLVMEETNTILLSGLALIGFYTLLS